MHRINRQIQFAFYLGLCLSLQWGGIFAQTKSKKLLTTGRFRVVFESIGEFSVHKIDGLISETPVNLDQEPSRIQPQKGVRPVHLVITRFAIQPDDLWQWRSRIIAGKKDKRSGQVALLDHEQKPVLIWHIKKAWPFKWVWPEFNANQPAPALEEIHFLIEEVTPVLKPVVAFPRLAQPIRVLKK